MNNLVHTILEEELPFGEKVFQVFRYQFEKNLIYQRFCEALRIKPEDIRHAGDIPLLPIDAFKEGRVVTGEWDKEELMFQSSGTSGSVRSHHYVRYATVYRDSLLKGFNHFYDLSDFVFWGYTPGYADNPHSSLIWMINELIRYDDSGLSRFLHLNESLNIAEIDKVKRSGKRLMLFGAAFGLIDLVQRKSVSLPEDAIVMETGGMKTHRREMSRADLHKNLADGFALPMDHIHSEYGMTELLSQAYARGTEWFDTPPWMKISIRNPVNPLMELADGNEGLIGILDLSNIYSCSFILTGDAGEKRPDGTFKVNGRWQKTNLRGCNFLIDRD